MIRVNYPYLGNEEVEALREVIRSGYLAYGPIVKEFEDEFSKYLGVRYALTVSNGTIALYSALKALNIGKGDEVIVPDFSFIATASAVILSGAKPIFADIDLDTYTLSPDDVERKVTSRTKAIIPVHLYGHPADMDPLIKLAEEHNLFIIEDCAQSHGAEYRGAKTGTLGTVGAFSFYATKNLTMGEGGAVTTNSDEIAEFIKYFRNHGQNGRYNHVRIGWNFRISSLQGAIGLAQLRKLDKMNSRRREVATLYNEALSKIECIKTPIEKSWAKHVYHQYTIWIRKQGLRDKLSKYLHSAGIQTSIHYPKPIHLQPALKEYGEGVDCPNSLRASSHLLSLPMHPGLTDNDVELVIKNVRRFFQDLGVHC